MTGTQKGWVIAIAVWAFLSLWIVGMTASLFGSACHKSNLTPDQRLFRCGWAWTLSAPFRTMGDPPARYARLQMTLGIAHAELGSQSSATKAFGHALRLAGLEPPVVPDRDLKDTPLVNRQAARDLYDRALALPEDSPARLLFLAVARGTLP